MRTSSLLATLLLALPFAAAAQTTPAPQQTTEVTEDLDPATGKVIRRTTRTITAPAAAPVSATSAVADVVATDAQVTTFLKSKTVVSTLSATALLDTYSRFMDKVRSDRRGWTAANWSAAAAVLSSLNARYEQLRPNYSLDDKVTIRSQQAEFQALRTARQLSDQVSDKL